MKTNGKKLFLGVLLSLFSFITFGQGGQKWSLNGNNSGQGSFLGTTNNAPLVLKTNNERRIKISPDGTISLFDFGLDSAGILGTDATGTLFKISFNNNSNYVLTGAGTFRNIQDLDMGWKVVGATTIYSEPGYKIGIGTNNPTEKLHVRGDQYPVFMMVQNNIGFAKIGFNGAHGIIESDHGLLLNYYSGQDVIVGGQNPGEGSFYSVHNTYLAANDGQVVIGPTENCIYPGNIKLIVDGHLLMTDGPNEEPRSIYWGYHCKPEWGLEYNATDGGLNFWNPYTSASGLANYRLFLQDGTGFIGIGTNNPTEKLHVRGDQSPVFMKVQNNIGYAKIGFNGAHGIIESDHRLQINYYSGQDVVVGGENAGAGSFYSMHNSYLAYDDGLVAIGCHDFDPGSLLTVDGKITAEDVEIKILDYPDYVFAKEYKLLTFDELRAFIELNMHLPNVPSATQVLEEGLSISDNSRVQMEKIEELTLYILQLEQRLKDLEETVKQQNNQ